MSPTVRAVYLPVLAALLLAAWPLAALAQPAMPPTLPRTGEVFDPTFIFIGLGAVLVLGGLLVRARTRRRDKTPTEGPQ